jgi:hypothetical protein
MTTRTRIRSDDSGRAPHRRAAAFVDYSAENHHATL